MGGRLGSGWLGAAVVVLAGLAALAAAAAEPLARARLLLEREQPEAALDELAGWLRDHPGDAEATLLRSSARFMLGDGEAGRRDLQRALELDPAHRPAWLHRAALDLADGELDGALEAFERAEALDPAAADNSLNIGAVLLLQGRLEEAAGRFGRYLGAAPGSAEAAYLVATNYALAGYAGLALEHLRRAVQLDERSRLRARNDPNFSELLSNVELQRLLTTDSYRPPPGAPGEARRFEARYAAGSGPLLGAVLDALQISGQPYDPRFEITPEWALVWSDLRIKVYDEGGDGVVELSAPAGRYPAAEWRRRTEELFRGIAVQIYRRQARRPEVGRR